MTLDKNPDSDYCLDEIKTIVNSGLSHPSESSW